MEYEERYLEDRFNNNELYLACIFEPTIGFIPIDENNSDYKNYLAWLEENK